MHSPNIMNNLLKLILPPRPATTTPHLAPYLIPNHNTLPPHPATSYPTTILHQFTPVHTPYSHIPGNPTSYLHFPLPHSLPAHYPHLPAHYLTLYHHSLLSPTPYYNPLSHISHHNITPHYLTLFPHYHTLLSYTPYNHNLLPHTLPAQTTTSHPPQHHNIAHPTTTPQDLTPQLPPEPSIPHTTIHTSLHHTL